MRALSVMALLICFAPAALASNIVSGLVPNQSRGQPAVDDEVILVPLDRGTQEEARTKTDAQGAFALNLQHPHDPHNLYLVPG
jgi:hypothetical protein